MSNRSSYSLARTFGNLKVRPKLMVLHNLFFLVLTCAAYFSLIPLFEKQVADGDAISRAKIALFVVLGSIYIAAVVLLEAVIMPLYVYRPLRRMLEADTATRAGDRKQRADSAAARSWATRSARSCSRATRRWPSCAARKMSWPPPSGDWRNKTAWSAWACSRPASRMS